MHTNPNHPIKKQSSVIILDRDGVINHDSPHYIKSPEEFVFLPGSLEAIRKFTTAGYQIGIATNQSGIGRGYYSEETLNQIHLKMLHSIQSHGGKIFDIAFCPHLPTDDCGCRKPKPGLLITLAKKINASLKDIIFIGDKLSDLKAAEVAGTQSILVRSSMTEPNIEILYPKIPAFHSLIEFADAHIQIATCI